jgi:hypothetical protein
MLREYVVIEGPGGHQFRTSAPPWGYPRLQSLLSSFYAGLDPLLE